MEYKKKIAIIDNQDALYGNHSYDLASLIDDVRVKTPTHIKNKIFEYYFRNCSIQNKQEALLKNDFNILFSNFSRDLFVFFFDLFCSFDPSFLSIY